MSTYPCIPKKCNTTSNLLCLARTRLYALFITHIIVLLWGVSLFSFLFAAPPTAVDDLYLQPLGAPTIITGPGILRNDTVPCGSAVLVMLTTSPLHGEVTALGDDGSFTYEPDLTAGQQADSFGYETKCPDTGLVSEWRVHRDTAAAEMYAVYACC